MWIREDTVSYSTVNVWRRAVACIASIILLVDILTIIKIYHASGSSSHSFKKKCQVHIIIYLLLVAQW